MALGGAAERRAGTMSEWHREVTAVIRSPRSRTEKVWWRFRARFWPRRQANLNRAQGVLFRWTASSSVDVSDDANNVSTTSACSNAASIDESNLAAINGPRCGGENGSRENGRRWGNSWTNNLSKLGRSEVTGRTASAPRAAATGSGRRDGQRRPPAQRGDPP
jgi:hypothetical protein